VVNCKVFHGGALSCLQGRYDFRPCRGCGYVASVDVNIKKKQNDDGGTYGVEIHFGYLLVGWCGKYNIVAGKGLCLFVMLSARPWAALVSRWCGNT